MLVNIHFQKYNRYKFFLESYLYCNNCYNINSFPKKFVTVILLKMYVD